jgi:hypothetical protein
MDEAPDNLRGPNSFHNDTSFMGQNENENMNFSSNEKTQ